MSKILIFLTNFIIAAFSHIGSIVLSIILIIIGLLWFEKCLYFGLFLFAANIIVAIVRAIRMQNTMNYRSKDDTEFNEMMDNFSADPKSFLSEIIETQEKNKQLHGKDLLTLSDDDLFDAIDFQNYEIAENADEDKELEQFAGARRTVYILSLFDSEIQNGGLCQFFVNSSRVVAPYVSESLKLVNANEHRTLFDDFIKKNNIDVNNLESFKIFRKRDYIKQTKRFDFDSFDEKYYDLPALQEKIVAYIKNNINEF